MAGTVQAATTVATIGDSFADSIYLGMLSRPDLLKRDGLALSRWSRPVIGLSRDDYFDYPEFLRGAGVAEFCVVQIGTNDMQAIPASQAGRWIAYGIDLWKSSYTDRVRKVVRILQNGHCGDVLWILQPGFEKQPYLARNRGLINELQTTALKTAFIPVFATATKGSEYSGDGMHYNHEFALEIGGAVERAILLARQVRQSRCPACHGAGIVRRVLSRQNLQPLMLPSVEPISP